MLTAAGSIRFMGQIRLITLLGWALGRGRLPCHSPPPQQNSLECPDPACWHSPLMPPEFISSQSWLWPDTPQKTSQLPQYPPQRSRWRQSWPWRWDFTGRLSLFSESSSRYRHRICSWWAELTSWRGYSCTPSSCWRWRPSASPYPWACP